MADKHNYFGDGPFSNEDYTDLANSVKRIVDKKHKGFKYTKEQIEKIISEHKFEYQKIECQIQIHLIKYCNISLLHLGFFHLL